jgi:flagellar assembly protein FliH
MKQQPPTGNSSPARKAAAERPDGARRPDHIRLFEYPADSAAPASPDWSAFGDDDEPSAAPAAADEPLDSATEQRLAEETRHAFESGRERGRQEGRQAERESMATTLKAAQDGQMRQMAGLMESFAAARDRYLSQVEREVVKLALAIAARILRREAQMDPLLLTGAARVALGQLSATTEARLRVPPGDLDLWKEAIALLPNLPLKPTVVPGDGLRLGDCIVETGLGTVDLGIRSQLAEIERGFFDRAGAGRAPRTMEPDGQAEGQTGEGARERFAPRAEHRI